MVAILLKGYVNESGELKVDIPDWIKLPPGVVKVTIQQIPSSEETQPGWTDEELDELLTFHPTPAEDMVAGGWEDMGITDSQSWVEEQRRKQAEERGWQTFS
jgi:hypothetical protein